MRSLLLLKKWAWIRDESSSSSSSTPIGSYLVGDEFRKELNTSHTVFMGWVRGCGWIITITITIINCLGCALLFTIYNKVD